MIDFNDAYTEKLVQRALNTYVRGAEAEREGVPQAYSSEANYLCDVEEFEEMLDSVIDTVRETLTEKHEKEIEKLQNKVKRLEAKLADEKK